MLQHASEEEDDVLYIFQTESSKMASTPTWLSQRSTRSAYANDLRPRHVYLFDSTQAAHTPEAQNKFSGSAEKCGGYISPRGRLDKSV